MTKNIRVLIRGAGDLATGVGHRLQRSGFSVFMTEIPEPRAVRRTVAFSECVFRGKWTIEGITAVRTASVEEALAIKRDDEGIIPVMVDPEGHSVDELPPSVLVDARMAKRNLGTTLSDSKIVIGLGPGFTAGEDVHAVVETARGHYLGGVIYQGRALEFTGVPYEIGGYTTERVLRAPGTGTLRTFVEIGVPVNKGQIVAEVVEPGSAQNEPGVLPVRCEISGLLRGLLRDGAPVKTAQKIGDVDPRCDPDAVRTISDKARAVAGGALEATCCLLWGIPPAGVS